MPGPNDEAGFLGPITDPRFVAAAVVLAVNDHLLKAAFGNWITGKLSDVAGLVVLPVLVVVALRALGFVRPERFGLGMIGGWFTLIKTVPTVAAATEVSVEAVTGAASTIVVDPTDLVGLVGLIGAATILRRPYPIATRRFVRYLMFGLAAVVCTASSSVHFGTPTDLAVDPSTGEVVGWLPEGDNRVVFPGEGVLAAETCVRNDPEGTCFRITGSRIEQREPGASWELVWALPGESRLVNAGDIPASYHLTLEATDIIAGPEGSIHVAFDGIDPVVRDASGVWTPAFQTYRPIAALIALVVLVTFGITMTIATQAWRLLRYAASIALVAIVITSEGLDGEFLAPVYTRVGLLAAVAVALIGAISLIRARDRLATKAVLVGLAGTSLTFAPIVYWKYAVSAPGWAVYGGFVVGALTVVVQLGLLKNLGLLNSAGRAPEVASVTE